MILIIQHLKLEGPGTLGKFFKNTSWDVHLLDLSQPQGLIELKDRARSGDFSDLEGVVVFGGPMNVYETEKYPFLQEETDFLRALINEEVPVLGICLGAQLLAKALGAKVKKCRSREIGFSRVFLTQSSKDDPLFRGLDSRLDVFQWHEDTFERPKEAQLLVEGQVCKNQAVRFSTYAWGLQFHPEMNLEMLKKWCKHYPIDVNKAKMLFDYFNRQEKYIYQAKLLYLNFARIITERKAAITT